MPKISRGAVHAWALNHDDSWLFIAPYIGLAVVLSLAISLFWLVIVVCIHIALEWYVHWREHPSLRHTLARVAWEVKLDIALILFALALGVYTELIMGVAGLSAAARGVQATGRFLAWQRGLRAVLLTLDDAAQVAKAAISSGRKAAVAAPIAPVSRQGWGGWTAPWTLGDRVSIGLGALCLIVLVTAPWTTGQTPLEILATLGRELDPWPH